METMLSKFVADLEREIENLKERREHELETARKILSGNYGERHRGHNLGNAGNEISELSAKIEQTQMILSDLRARIEFASVKAVR